MPQSRQKPRRGTASRPRRSQLGIDPAKTYPLADFMLLSGFGRDAMRSARRKGLPVLHVSNRAFVKGSDFVAWLESHSKNEAAGSGPSVDAGMPS